MRLTEYELNGKIIGRGDRMPRQKSGLFNQQEYVANYNKENIVYRKLSFNRQKPDDMKLLEWIDGQRESTSAYLKRLVMEDLIAALKAQE